jgi:hypothetical protein
VRRCKKLHVLPLAATLRVRPIACLSKVPSPASLAKKQILRAVRPEVPRLKELRVSSKHAALISATK